MYSSNFSKAERIDYARRLERIESLKAKGRMSDGGKGRQKSDNLRTDDSVAEKLGIGSRDTYRKEKYIVENQTSLTTEDFADWDEGKLSTNKAFNKISTAMSWYTANSGSLLSTATITGTSPSTWVYARPEPTS